MSFNEYWGGKPPTIKGVLGMTKLRNMLLALDPTLKVELKNTRVNGQLRGCYGFITNTSGNIVYVNTETSYDDETVLYRTAENNRDYSGGMNNFAEKEEIASDVITLLNKMNNRSS